MATVHVWITIFNDYYYSSWPLGGVDTGVQWCEGDQHEGSVYIKDTFKVLPCQLVWLFQSHPHVSRGPVCLCIQISGRRAERIWYVCSFIMFYIQIQYVYEILKLSLQISQKHAANLVDISVQVKYVLSIDHSEPPSDAEARAWLLHAYACTCVHERCIQCIYIQ